MKRVTMPFYNDQARDSLNAINRISYTPPIIAVVLPCYRTTRHVLDVIRSIGPEVSHIFAVDDKCPEHTGDLIKRECCDPRVRVLRHEANRGVGGAVKTGYQAALEAGCDIIVKVDSDGQMDPALIPLFVQPILDGKADYTKGNRFFNIEKVKNMPTVRLVGNAGLSFINKFSTGYWRIFDPTNGYTAIHATVAALLPFNKISDRYFFESDMLFRLNTFQGVVVDIPMEAVYGDEQSNLRVRKIFFEFLWKHVRNFFKRIFYNYYLRDMSIASLVLPLGILMVIFGTYYGVSHWIYSVQNSIYASAGTVMLAVLPIMLGIQFLLSFLHADMAVDFREPLHIKIRSSYKL